MPEFYELFVRLEPSRPIEDLNRGFRAEIFDPVWFLGRQWQLGEHQGEDASSPMFVEYAKSEQPFEPRPENPALDPKITPPEAIVEAELQTWTPGQRIRIGAAIARSHNLPTDPTLMLKGLPAPYDRFNGKGYDGRELFERRVELKLDNNLLRDLLRDLLPMSEEDSWNYEEFNYKSSFRCAGRNLSIERHTGGRLDWYSVDADGKMPDVIQKRGQVLPARVRFPGAPQPRWWQIENAQVDIGGFPPDRSHFPTMLLIDLIASHSDDWFYFPVDASTGHVLTLHEVKVLDSFGGENPLDPASDWSLFKVKGLESRSMVVCPTLPSPLTGPLLENVVIGVNEDANLVWAVERRINGQDVQTPDRESFGDSGGADTEAATGQKQFDFLVSTDVIPNWHPYVIPANQVGKRRLIQGRLRDLKETQVVLTPEAEAKMLNGPNDINTGPLHQIEPSAVPSLGLSLSRGFVLGRMTNGEPVLWIQRQSSPLISPPALRLRFDVLQDRIKV